MTLAESLVSLRNNARSFDELATWVKLHPQAIPSISLYLDNGESEVTVSANRSAIVSSLVRHGFLQIRLNVALFVKFALGPELAQLRPEGSGNGARHPIRYNFPLNLTLDAWPLLSALAAVDVLNNSKVLNNPTMTCRSTEVVELINPHLQHHFPGYSLELLEQLRLSDLLPVNAKGHIDETHVVDLLFASRAPQHTLALPAQLIP